MSSGVEFVGIFPCCAVAHLPVARLRNLRRQRAPRPAGAVCRHPHRCRAERGRRAGDALLPAGQRLPARPAVLPDHRHHAPGMPGEGHSRTPLRGTHRAGAGPARHHRRGVQHDPFRRRDHAFHVLAQPDRPLRPRVAERLRALGPARRGAHGLRPAARGHPVAAQARRQPQLQADGPHRRQWPGPRGRPRRPERRSRHAGTGAPDPHAPAAAVRLLPGPAQERPGGPGAGPADQPAGGETVPAHHGHVPGRARVHWHPVAAGHAPDQQERTDRLGPGAFAE